MPLLRLIHALLISAMLIGTTASVVAVASSVAPSESDVRATAGAGNAAARGDRNGRAARADRGPGAASSTSSAATPAPDPTASTTPETDGAPAGGSPSDPAGTTSADTSGTTSGATPISGPAGNGLVYIGSVAGGYEQALAGTGVDLANHAYAFFTSKVPVAEMITVSAGNTRWRDVAAAGPGSALYNEIVRWAQTIKARGGSVMLAYNHEPEAHDRLTLGSADEFIAAWRHVRTIFDQQGVTNVEWTWQMTAYSFRVSPTSDQYAPKWYPGDAFVDNIGADAYNWISCGATGTGKYNEMQFLGDPVLAFARAHGKRASFPEFASHENGNRTQWLANAHQYFVQNRDVLTAAFYFNRPPTIASNADCRWGLTAASEYGALRDMAQDTAYFRV